MKTITKTYNIYTFDELSPKVKEELKTKYLNDDFLQVLFNEDVRYFLLDTFPNSDIKYQYSLGYCQGDGFNIYGELDPEDMIDILQSHLNIKELKTIKHYLIDNNICVELPRNHFYNYCIASSLSFTDTVENELYHYKNLNIKLLNKCENILKEYIENICDKMEADGYKCFYEVDDETLQEYYNDFEFYEDGSIYYE